MPQPPSPTMRKRRLGEELRKLREASGVAAEQAAAELDCSVAKIRHIEGGRNAPSKSDLTVLCNLYGAGADVHAVLEEIRKSASKPGWWSTYRLPKWLQTYVGAEADAHTVSNFELELIPGLLQTEAYARALHELVGASDIGRKVAARGKRQERLTAEDDPLTLHAIISEAALRRLNGAEFGKQQFRHLITMAERPNIHLQVLPFSVGLHVSLSGGFVLLDFDPEVSMPAGYLEYAAGGQLVDDPVVVGTLRERFATLREQAMSERDSVDFIREWA
jgi:transcriptional regulator with XRE-family HTH domain